MEKLITKIITESYKSGVYYYEIGFENLELRDIISNSNSIEINDISTLQSVKNDLLIENGVILFNYLKYQFPDIAKNYEL